MSEQREGGELENIVIDFPNTPEPKSCATLRITRLIATGVQLDDTTASTYGMRL